MASAASSALNHRSGGTVFAASSFSSDPDRSLSAPPSACSSPSYTYSCQIRHIVSVVALLVLPLWATLLCASLTGPADVFEAASGASTLRAEARSLLDLEIRPPQLDSGVDNDVIVDRGELATAAASPRDVDDGREGDGDGIGRVWISLSLCAMDDTLGQLMEKGLPEKATFPYAEAAIEAVRLWRNVAGANVIVAVVSDGGEDDGQAGTNIAERLRDAGGAAVRVIRPDPALGCVTESQMQRMYAYEHEDVADGDIVVTADVDSLPTTPAVLGPLLDRQYDAWVWQHSYSESTAYTFPMSFVGMRASLWRTVTSSFRDGRGGGGGNGSSRGGGGSGMRGWQNKKKMKPPSNHWGSDQELLTHALLNLGLCSSSNEMLWRRVGLDPEPFDDAGRCFHGTDDHRHSAQGGWKWVHFAPDHNATDVKAVAGLISRHHQEGGTEADDRKDFVQELVGLLRKNSGIASSEMLPSRE